MTETEKLILENQVAIMTQMSMRPVLSAEVNRELANQAIKTQRYIDEQREIYQR